jgi:hypothetical protein
MEKSRTLSLYTWFYSGKNNIIEARLRVSTVQYISADVHGCRTDPSSGKVYAFQRVLVQWEREGWKCRGVEGKGTNFFAKFGRYVSIRGASEDPEKNINLPPLYLSMVLLYFIR